MKTIEVNNMLNRCIKKAEEQLSTGYEIVLDFGTKANPEKIDRVLTYFNENYGIEVCIRHAELREMIESGIYGGLAGAGAGFLAALYFGGPVGWCILGGALVGTLIGSLSQVLYVTVYKSKGRTKMKIEYS
jgi:hypothetical protein